MKKQPLILEDWPEDGYPYFWFPQRVPHCPKQACRRAARCLRPEREEGKGPPNWPSCRMVTREEWSIWGVALYRAMKRRYAESCAENQEAIEVKGTTPWDEK